MKQSRKIEYTVAVASFVAAVALSFVSLLLADQHEVAAGNCTLVAQFLLLTASIFGIDYKYSQSIVHGDKESNQSGNQPG